MKKWGLNIEHEMRVRFKNNISELPRNIQDKLFPTVKNEYIFISSNTLLYYFQLHELIIMQNFDKYVTTEYEKIYLKNFLLKKKLLEKAKNKFEFPLEDKSFFDIHNEKNIDNSLKLLFFYLNLYTLYHCPLLFFTYNFNDEIRMNLNTFLDFDEILDLIHNKEENKDKIIDLIKLKLNNLYNDTYEKEAFSYLKKLFKKQSIKSFNFNNINTTNINIEFIYGDNELFDIDIFFNKIDKYITTIKNIFINNNFKIEGIDSYKFYKNLFNLYNNELPIIDTTYETMSIKFKTLNNENISYEEILNNLIELEKTFFYILNNIPLIKNLTNMFGELVYHNIGSVKNSISLVDIINIDYYTIKEDYSGDYYITITAPYNSHTTMKNFINIHSILANKLQLLEPILASHFSSPSYNAINNNSNSQSSLRQFLNKYSNCGTSDILLIYGAKKHVINKYYLSENDILNNKSPIKPVTEYQSSIYNMNGELIINYDKLNNKNITNNLFKSLDKGNEESENTNINIQNYFSLIFEKTKIRPKMSNHHMKYLKLGADIRTFNLNDYMYPLDKDWERCLLMKKNKLHEIYYNRKINKISYERIYDKNNHKKDLLNRIGIEFRILDHFPTNYLNQLLALLVPIVLDTIDNPKNIKLKNTYVTKQFWHNEMYNVIINGYEYTLGIEYIKMLEKEFNIDIPHKKSINSEMILDMLYNKMCKKYKKTYKNSLYNKMKFKSEIKFVNFNKKAWFEIINIFFEENPQKLREILYYNKNLNNDNILEILGKKFNYSLTKIKNYLLEINTP